MATIRKRTTEDGKARWQAIVRRKGAPSVAQTFKTKTNAKRWAEGVEDEIKGGRFLPRVQAEMHTVGEAIEQYEQGWLDDQGNKIPAPLLNLAPHEQRNRKARLAWWKKKLGALSLAALTQQQIAKTRNTLLAGGGPSGEPVSGPTVNRYTAALSAVLKLAVNEWGWLEDNPARKVTRQDENPGRVRYLEKETELPSLLNACRASDEPRLYTLVQCALASGARQGELMALRWKYVKRDNTVVQATLQKTKNRDRRVVFFPGEAGELLRDSKEEGPQHIGGYVFAGPRTPKDKPPNFPTKAWQRAVKAAGIVDFTFHDLRHTFASYAAMTGASLPELAALLGHRSMQMVMRYTHVAEQHQEKVAARMAEKFLGVS